MHDVFKKCKNVINNRLNPVWKTLPNSIPSRVTKVALFYWVRTKALPAEAEVRAKNSSKQRCCKSKVPFVLADRAEEIADEASRLRIIMILIILLMIIIIIIIFFN